MRRLDPAYRARFADGSTIHVRHGREAMRAEIAGPAAPVDAAAFDGFVDWLQQLYEVEMPHFIDRNFDSPLGLLASPRAARSTAPAGRVRPARRRGAAAVPRSAAAPAVQLPGHVRRAGSGRRRSPSTP